MTDTATGGTGSKTPVASPKNPLDNDNGNGGDGQTASNSIKPRLFVVIWLIAVTIPLLICGKNSLQKLEGLSSQPVTQGWSAPAGVSVNVGPETFIFDAEKGMLQNRGPVTKAQQEELRGLINFADSVSQEDRSKIRASYILAVDRLSDISRSLTTDVLMWLLVVGGVFGAAGTLARVYGNFLTIACYRGGKGFDLKVWWPYYILLPILGFLMGIFVTVLLKANLLSVENQSPSGNLWWAGISIIVGFGALDVSERLKSLGQALFGTSKKPRKDG